MDFLRAKWQQLIMANYEVDPEILLPFIPSGTQLDFYNEKAYVSLVGFLFARCRMFGFPIPGLHTFEEVNLRFYVKRKMGNDWRKGVVFINETVPNKLIAAIANGLYKEHYISLPTRHSWHISETGRQIEYYWQLHKKWNFIKVNAAARANTIQDASKEEFIFEHYYGYTKRIGAETIEYKIKHPRWETYAVQNFGIECDFGAMYGTAFKSLSDSKPDSVMLAEGSAISVEWKRHKI